MIQEAFYQDTLPTIETEVKSLILYLTDLLNNRDMDKDKKKSDILVENLKPIKESLDKKD